jgi:uncharacterized protein HemX
MRFTARSKDGQGGDEARLDPTLEQALGNFRRSVHGWSEAAHSRPRTAAQAVRHGNWRLAAGFALSCVLAAGTVTGGVMHVRHQRQEMARIALARAAAEQQRLAAARQVRAEDEDLLAKVDSDVSRQVPNAMEPLAQLMEMSGTE